MKYAEYLVRIKQLADTRLKVVRVLGLKDPQEALEKALAECEAAKSSEELSIKAQVFHAIAFTVWDECWEVDPRNPESTVEYENKEEIIRLLNSFVEEGKLEWRRFVFTEFARIRAVLVNKKATEKERSVATIDLTTLVQNPGFLQALET